MDKIFNVMGMIVVVAGVTTVVIHPNSAQVIRELGNSFATSIRAAIGG